MLMFPNIVAFLFFPNCQKQDFIQCRAMCQENIVLSAKKYALCHLAAYLFVLYA